ncbi:hypothetical protein GOBAR_AA21204 [Gossypium barbadense]|uniref:Phorbol-ester/DAG-type domain-containing protein n=1 Tax=Gossypium barbadense TaxID=3634 RepID=A0A2P5X830_GOSBA|nr:hypothetical protein GOBAR_AA21204 [Gossypium barbadense]
MESQNLEHIHPLVFNEEQSNETKKAKCSRCGEVVSDPSFSCGECEFSLHKKCAEAPSKIDRPYHHHHPLVLLPESPYVGSCYCDFCYKKCDFFVYHCSCGLDFHIKCALFTLSIAEQKLQELNHIATKDPSVFLEEGNKELENAKCFGCWLPLGESRYFSVACGFNLHIKCAELPHEINHPFHKEHPLVLQFNIKRFSCKICGETRHRGFLYCCSACSFALHIKCAQQPTKINHLSHRRHPLVLQLNSGNLLCKTCQETQHEKFGVNPITCVIEQNESGEMTRIKHFSHAHDLILSDNVMENDITCDGCMLLILDSFYCCTLQCNFFLHKVCAKSPRKKHLSFHGCQELHILVVGYLFKCSICEYDCGGFSYKCNKFNVHICLQCSVIDYRTKHPGHQHPILYNRNQHGRCNGCGETWRSQFSCKHCDFNLDFDCSRLTLTTRHKRHEHPLALAYHEGNDYLKYHYCDLCEKERDPNLWFYHCAICEFSAHPNCVLPGSMYKGKGHPHPLTFVWKPYRYIVCCKCSKPCKDLVLECAELTCNYIVH